MNRSKSGNGVVSDSSRRDFLKATAIMAGACGTLGALGSCERGSSETKNGAAGLPLTLAGYRYDRVEALIDGHVGVEGCKTQFREAAIGDLNTHVFSGPQTIDVAEIGLHPYMLAHANDGFRDYALLPVFPLRLFRHKSIFVRTDRGIDKPEDLRGKTVGTPGYSSTSLTWIRGILQDDYGIGPDDVHWVAASKDSAAQDAGKVSKQEQELPEGIEISPGPPGMDESDLLVSGEVDALFHAAEPRAYVEGHPKVARLFPDYRATERAYFRQTGIFPIMHALAIRKALIDENPWLVKAVFEAFSRAKALAFEFMARYAWFKGSLPWFGQEFEETRTLMGENYWSYGIEPNRKTLETLFRYSHRQGLCDRELEIEELFDPRGLELAE